MVARILILYLYLQISPFPNVSIVESLELPCLETATQLILDLAGDPNEVNIQWSSQDGNIVSGSTGTMPQVEGLGYYFVNVQNLSSGCIIEDSILVSNNQDVPSAAVLNLMDETCLGSTNGMAQISSVEGGASPYLYTLNNVQSNPEGIFNDLQPGVYDLNITDAEGCAFDTSFTIEPGIDLQLELPPLLELAERHCRYYTRDYKCN